jgi:hypothetical protein
METQLQDYLNGICCDTPQGKITLTGGIADGLYTDLASAIAYIQTFTSATITDASLSGDTFKFTVPAGSNFSLVDGFIKNTAASFSDTDGLVAAFKGSAFVNNSGNNTLGTVTFGQSAFENASGVNTIANILLTNNNNTFANVYAGTMNISGNIGTTEGNDYPNFFSNASGATINALAIKVASNGGAVEGDLDLAQTNGAQVNYVL